MFAVLQLADFSLHAVLRTTAGASAGPVALLDGAARRTAIVACNRAARAQGVEPGQTAPQALAYCRDLRLCTRSASAEAEARAALLAAGFTLSPRVELTADGVCTADLSGLDEARGQALLAAAVQGLLAAGLPATGGLAATPLLALYAARSIDLEAEAREPAPASGRRWRRVTDARAFLAPLPLAAADPAPELAPVLATWGIRTLGALTALPKADVARRLGAAGRELWERAAGETTRVLRLVEPPRTFAAAMEFEQAVETLEPLLFVLRRFLDRLVLELETAFLAAGELELTLVLTDGTTTVRSFRLPEPTTRAEVLRRTLHTHLEQLHTDAPLHGVRLRVEPTRPGQRQQGLFETELRDPHGFAETLARVVAIVGAELVGTPAVADTHRPDAVVLNPPAPVVPPPEPDPPVLPPEGLPLRRFRPALPARVETEAGAPVSVWSARVSGIVQEWRGPWRGAGDWWEAARAWQREEWDVELSGGGLFRLLRTADGWFVEGEYD